jgi:hypothetical protein
MGQICNILNFKNHQNFTTGSNFQQAEKKFKNLFFKFVDSAKAT